MGGESTLYAHLLSEGFTSEEIEARFEVLVPLRAVGLSFFREDVEDEPIVGVTYSGDYRYEEEAGTAMLGTRFASPERQLDYVSKHEFEGELVYVFSVQGKGALGDWSLQLSMREAVRRHLSPLVSVPGKCGI